MIRPSHADDPEARRLREGIAADLLALRDAFARRKPAVIGGDIPDQVGKLLRANPAWAAAAAAGALAGLVAAVRSRTRRPSQG